MKIRKIGQEISSRQVSFAAIAFFVLATLVSPGCKDLGSDESDPGSLQKKPEEPGMLYDVAGVAGSLGNSGNDGPAVNARLYWPVDVWVYDVTGDIYITDWNNHVYRTVSPTGIIKKVFGSGLHGDDFDGPVTEINLNHPGGLTVGPIDGNFYLAVWHNWKIKMVDKNTLYATSVVGTDAGFGGDGGPGYLANIFLPSAVVFDPIGNMYITDQGNGRIRKVDKATGTINTFAGQFPQGWTDGFGFIARFNWTRGNDAYPGGRIDIDATAENLYVADQLNNRIRKVNIATRMVSTIAGNGTAGYSGDGGPAMQASLNYPCDVSCAPNGDVYVADTRNNAVRKIDAAGNISTVAGTGVSGFSPNGTLASQAMLNYVTGIYFEAKTNILYIADTYNSQIKRVKIQ